LSWVKEHLGIVLGGFKAIFLAFLGSWFTGLLNQILPSPSATRVWFIEGVKDFRRIRPSTNKFLIMVAQLDGDDPEGTHTRAVARAFQGQSGIERTRTRRVLRLSDIGSDAESKAVATGRYWLTRRNADLLIWGEVLQKEKFLTLWFISKDASSDFLQSRFQLDANLLDQSFSEVTPTQLVAIALSGIKPATEVRGTFHRHILRPVAHRLRHLIDNSAEFTLH